MAYFQATNTGKGFITHADNEAAHVAGFPGNVWVTENTTWASRVGAVSKTKDLQLPKLLVVIMIHSRFILNHYLPKVCVGTN